MIRFFEMSNEIVKIIFFIINFLKEINFFVLNVLIEVLRVGEVGKGFMVVVNEIRKFFE